MHHPEVAAAFAPLIESGVVATCGVIEFELGWATESSAEFDQVRADRDAGYEWLATHDEDWRRALDVQAALRRLVKFCTKRFRGNAAEAEAEANVSGRSPVCGMGVAPVE